MFVLPRAVAVALLRSALPVVAAVIAVAASLVAFASCGCSAGIGDVAEPLEEGDGEVWEGIGDTAWPTAGDAAELDGGPGTTPAADAGPAVADAIGASPDSSPPPRDSAATSDAGARDAPGPADADGGACRRACLISGSSGADLPLGSTTCTWDGECCSGSCYVVHPGTGERGTCVAPGGAALWCGGAQEWCPEAVSAGVARCVSSK